MPTSAPIKRLHWRTEPDEGEAPLHYAICGEWRRPILTPRLRKVSCGRCRVIILMVWRRLKTAATSPRHPSTPKVVYRAWKKQFKDMTRQIESILL
jgi:hypothetical protein